MYIFKNAIRNILRSIGRNFLIGIIALVIAASSYIALSIKNSATEAEKSGKESLNVTASISLDRDKIMEDAQKEGKDPREAMKSFSSLTLPELQTYAKSKNVTDFYYRVSSSINGDQIEAVDESSSSTTDTNMEKPKSNGESSRRGKEGEFTLNGYSSNKAMTSFLSGTSKITLGNMFDESASNMDCIISSELAKLNTLAVGSKIIISNPNNEDEVYTLNVTGIYENTESTSNNMRFSTSSDPANQIYTSYNTLKTILDASLNNATISTNEETGEDTTTALRSDVKGTYVFKDISNFNAFKSEVKTMGLNENYSVESSDINNYEKSLLPLKNLSKFAGVFLIVVLAIGSIILVVLNIFSIRERKYEVGVLTAIGMKKKNVLLQYLSEIFIVMFTAIIIGTGIGVAASPKIANNLLSAQVESEQAQKLKVESNFGRMKDGSTQGGVSSSRSSSVDYIKSIDASADFDVIIKILEIGIGLILVSGSGAIIFILRYEPLKILSNRA